MKLTTLVSIGVLTLCNILTVYFLKTLSMAFTLKYSFREIYCLLLFKEFYLAALAGACSVTLFIYVNSVAELSRFVPILTGMVTFMTSGIGILVFHETVTTPKIIGLIAIVFSIILLSK